MSKVLDLAGQINKEYGDIFVSASYLVTNPPRIIPTTLGLDIALSGGLLEGRLTTIAAPAGAGKTTLCLTILAQAQKLYKKKCIYIDAECRLNKELLGTIPGLVWTEAQAKETGCPALQIIRPTEDKFISAEEYLNILNTIFKEDKNCSVVLDSIAALCSTALQGTKLGESRQMLRIPQFLYDFCRQTIPIIAAKKHDLIVITHMQANPTGYGNPLKATGGNAIEFFSSNFLYCYSSKEIDGDDENGRKIGKNTTFKLKKSALGPPNMEAVIPIRYGRGVDPIEDLVSLGEEFGFIEKAGAWYNLKDSKEKYQGKAAMVAALREDTKLQSSLDSKIRSIALPKGPPDEKVNSASKK